MSPDEAIDLPRITVVIPVRPTETASGAVGSLLEVDYPPEKIEVLVIRGTQPSKQRNLGIKSAGGDVMYFLDNDSCVSRDLFKIAAGHFEEPAVIGVAGPNVSRESDLIVARAVDGVFCSVFGTGGIRARYASVGSPRVASEHDVIFCNLAIRRPILDEVGGLNENLYPNEENELYERLVGSSAQAHFVYDPAAVVTRPRSESVGAHLRQIFCYGVGRMKQTFYRPNVLCLLHMIPAFFLLYVGIVPWLGIPLLLAPLGLYGVLLLVFCVRGGLACKSVVVAAVLVALFPLTHLAYGAGLIVGFLRYAFLRWRPRKGSAELVVVKKFEDGLSSAKIPQ